MDNASPGIYAIRNTVNRKTYIGKAVSVKTRWKDHRNDLNAGYHKNRHLQHAWNKYGADAFEFTVLEYCPVDQLNEREIYLIALYDSRKNGYNQTDGGDGTRGRITTDETRRKIGQANKGRAFTEEHRQKIGESRKGRTHTEESRQKMSAAKRNVSEETRAKLSIARSNISEELRRQIGEANRRRPPMSEETRRKISEAAKKREAAKRLFANKKPD